MMLNIVRKAFRELISFLGLSLCNRHTLLPKPGAVKKARMAQSRARKDLGGVLKSEAIRQRNLIGERIIVH